MRRYSPPTLRLRGSGFLSRTPKTGPLIPDPDADGLVGTIPLTNKATLAILLIRHVRLLGRVHTQHVGGARLNANAAARTGTRVHFNSRHQRTPYCGTPDAGSGLDGPGLDGDRIRAEVRPKGAMLRSLA